MMKSKTILLILSMLLLTACVMPAAPATTETSAEPTTAPAEETVPDPTAAPAEEVAVSDDLSTFTIDPAQSEARYLIDEDLRGNRITVVGTTSAINGQLQIDPITTANTQIGTFSIDAASFATDSSRRDGAVRRFVLVSGTYPTITFTPTSLNALPATIAVGDTISFEIRGDLTVKEHTQSEIFKTTITVDSEDQLSGAATSAIAYADYGIFIPDVPMVANVGDQLVLEFDFVAVK